MSIFYSLSFLKEAKIEQSRDVESYIRKTKFNQHMGIRERFDFPSFVGLDKTKTTKVPKLHFYALLRYQASTSNDNAITLQCNAFF